MDTLKELLRSGGATRTFADAHGDAGLAPESLKAYDEGLGPIIEMWRKEKEKACKVCGRVSRWMLGRSDDTGCLSAFRLMVCSRRYDRSNLTAQLQRNCW